MTPLSAFKTFFGINLHFTSEGYSVLKYGLDTKAATSKYNLLSEGNKYRFSWLSEKMQTQQDLVYLCIATQFSEIDVRFSSKEEILKAYYNFKSRREGLSYILTCDRDKHFLEPNPSIDKIIYKYFIGTYTPEYILLLTDGTELLELLYNSPNLSWAKQSILKLIKYRDFLNVKKYQSILNQNEYSSVSI